MRTITRIDMRLPWWVPGAGFKKEAARLAPEVDEMVNKPYQTVKDALVRLLYVFQSHTLKLTSLLRLLESPCRLLPRP
jgi:hypothetical protein